MRHPRLWVRPRPLPGLRAGRPGRLLMQRACAMPMRIVRRRADSGNRRRSSPEISVRRERRVLSVGESPTRHLSLQPVAIGAVVEVTKRLRWRLAREPKAVSAVLHILLRRHPGAPVLGQRRRRGELHTPPQSLPQSSCPLPLLRHRRGCSSRSKRLLVAAKVCGPRPQGH
jgi:hypothetical protein